jgi:hypothetical protein
MSDNSTSGPTSDEQKFVDIVDASDEDISYFLENNNDQYGEELDYEKKELVDDQSEQSQTETDSEPTQEAKPEPQDKVEAKDEAPQDEKIKRLQEELEVERKRAEQRELFLKKQSNELGSLRQQLKERAAALAEQVSQAKDEDPFTAMRLQNDLDKTEEKIANVDQDLKVTQHRLLSQQLFAQHASREVTPSVMRSVLEEDGLDPDFLNTFEQDPWVHMLPETIIQLAKRAETKLKYEAEIASLKQQLGQLEQKSKGKNETEIVRKIQEASKGNGTLRNSSGVGHKPISANDLVSMSDEELAALIA